MNSGDLGGDFALHRAAMDHLLGVACTLTRATSAAISLVQNGIGRTIAHKGLRSGNVTFRWPKEDAPYAPDKTIIVQELKDVRIARVVKSIVGDVSAGTFIRTPIINTEDYSIACLLLIPPQENPPSKSEMMLLRSITKSLSEHLKVIVDHFLKSGSSVTIAASFVEMESAVNNDEGLRAILDKKLNIIAMSDLLAERIGVPQSRAIGLSYLDLNLPMTSTMAHLYKRALETGITTPEVDAISSRTGLKRSYRFKGSPIRPIDHSDDLLEITFLETTPPEAFVFEEAASKGLTGISPEGLDATSNFLFDTLIHKRVVRSRNDMSFMTIRNWRSAIKEHQIKAFRAIKKAHHSAFAERVGKEFAQEIDNLVGRSTFKFVVPVPCGHSIPGACMAFSLARSLGAELGLPVIDAFVHLDQKGSSHPKTNASRPPMRLIQAVPGPALLIDDVATSGSHLEEASTRLKAAGTETFAMAWISGESA